MIFYDFSFLLGKQSFFIVDFIRDGYFSDIMQHCGFGNSVAYRLRIHYKFVGYLELPSLARQHNYREETRKGVAVEYVPNALPA